jgi:hypothetical protein
MASYERLDYGSPDGCKIGGAATDKIGFFDAVPVVQQPTVAAATDATTVITTANACRTALRALGLMA